MGETLGEQNPLNTATYRQFVEAQLASVRLAEKRYPINTPTRRKLVREAEDIESWLLFDDALIHPRNEELTHSEIMTKEE